MSPAGVFLRSIAALLLGVTAFTALGYTYVAMGVRDTLRSPKPLLMALEKHDAYNRVYDEGIISEQFEGELMGLVGDFSIEPETEAWLLKEILPPSELKTATERSVTSVIGFLNNETDSLDVSSDLAAAIPRIAPAVFRLVDERIDKAQRITVTGEEELQSSVDAIVRNIAAGTFPDTVPALDQYPPNWVINAFVQSTELLPDEEARQTAKANLAHDALSIVNALESGDTNRALKLAARAIADPVIDDSIANLREDLDDKGRFSAIDKIAESVGSRHETLERFRFARTALRLLVGAVAIVAAIAFVATVAGISGVFYPYPKHMARWPGVTLVVCGVMFLIVGLSISSFVGVWESLWCPFVEVPSCNLTIDVASELLSDAANGMTLWSIALTAVGILAIIAARFLPAEHMRGAQPPTGDSGPPND